MKTLFQYQIGIKDWVISTLGISSFESKRERALRFIEEATEVLQSLDIPEEEVRAVVKEVYSRPKGDFEQEVGGVFITLLALCHNQNVISEGCLRMEYNRIHTPEVIEKCKRRQAEKKAKGF